MNTTAKIYIYSPEISIVVKTPEGTQEFAVSGELFDSLQALVANQLHLHEVDAIQDGWEPDRYVTRKYQDLSKLLGKAKAHYDAGWKAFWAIGEKKETSNEQGHLDRT